MNYLEWPKYLFRHKLKVITFKDFYQRDKYSSRLEGTIYLWDGVILQRFATK